MLTTLNISSALMTIFLTTIEVDDHAANPGAGSPEKKLESLNDLASGVRGG